MRIHYTYTVYEGFPRATEVSRSREAGLSMYSLWCGWGFIFGIIISFASLRDGILLLLASVGGFLYLAFGYNKVTQKKIKKAMAKDINDKEKERLLMQKTIANKWKCEKIILLGNRMVGTCMVCFNKNQKVTLCDVTQDKITRNIYVCDCCVSKFRSNSI